MIEFIGSPAAGSLQAFSRVTRAGGFLFVSGSSAPHDPARGVLRGATATDEVRNALTFIADVLQAAGSGLDQVVQVTMLITDPADYAECNAEYIRHFPAGLPARQTARFGVPTEARVAFACMALAAS